MDPVKQLARELEQIKKGITAKGSTPQIGNSTMEGGSLGINDNSGQLRGLLGTQADGTNTVAQFNAPPPPAPSKPTVEILPAAARVKWDGLWVDAAAGPMDLSRIDVHIISDPLDDPLTLPSSTSIYAAGWGDASVPLIPDTYYAVLVAWNTSGKWSVSELSDPFTVDEISVDLAGVPHTYVQDTAPTGASADDFWVDTSTPAKTVYYWDGDSWEQASKIIADSITALEIAADTITANEIAADTITANEIASGTITANEIAAGTITAQQLVADFITGFQIEVEQLRSGTLDADLSFIGRLFVGDRADWNGDTGVLTIYQRDLDSEGNKVPLIVLDPDGSVFKGRVEADDVSILQGLVLLGTASHIATGARVTVDAGVADPTNAPYITFATQQTAFQPLPAGYTERGLRWDTVTSSWLRLLVKNTGDRAGVCRIERISAAGAHLGTITLDNVPGIGEDDFNGVVRIGSYYYVSMLNGPTLNRSVAMFDTTGAYVNRSAGFAVDDQRSCVGIFKVGTTSYPTLSYFVPVSGGYELITRILDPSTLATVTLMDGIPWDAGWSRNLMYVNMTQATVGSSIDVQVCAGQTARRFTMDGAFNYVSTDLNWAFDLGQTVASGGAAPDATGTWFASYGLGSLQKFSNWYPALTDKLYAAFVNTNGILHTAPSPIGFATPLNNRRFAVIDISAGAAVTSADIYAKVGTSMPAVSTLLKRPEALSTSRIMVIDPSNAGAGAPPATSTFGAGVSGEIRSATTGTAGWSGTGDGAFTVRDPLMPTDAVNKHYVDDLLDDTGWINLAYASGFTSGTPGPLAYRVKAGFVFIRGGATGVYTAGTQVPVNNVALPSSARPSATVHSGTFGQASGGAVCEVRTDGFIYLAPENGAGTPAWIAADISYPLG